MGVLLLFGLVCLKKKSWIQQHVPVIRVGESGDRRMPGACWPASLVGIAARCHEIPLAKPIKREEDTSIALFAAHA